MVYVLKFGGTSLAGGECIADAAKIVRDCAREHPTIVVASAMAGISDSLLSLARGEGNVSSRVKDLHEQHIQALNEAVPGGSDSTRKVIDDRIDELGKLALDIGEGDLNTDIASRIASFGEKLVVPILSASIGQEVESEWVYGDDSLIFIDDIPLNPEPLMDETCDAVRARLSPLLDKGIVPVVTGFIGCTLKGQTALLGRGSSDHISAILGACLDADEIQIWTDVDGLLTADPEIVDNPRLIEKISFGEASELAYFGAKVLHPKSILPTMRKNIPIRVLNTKNLECTGTLIVNEMQREPGSVTAVTAKKGITLVEIESTKMLAAYGFLSRIFEIFSRHSVSIDMISTTEVSVSLTIDQYFEGELEDVIDEIGEIAKITVLKEKALICVIGEGMASHPGIAGRIFTRLGQEGINTQCISQGGLEINISFVVEDSEADKAVRALHSEIFD